MSVEPSDLLAFGYVPLGASAIVLEPWLRCALRRSYLDHPAFVLQDVPVEALTTVKPYCNEIHAQAQLWLKRDPKASYEAWKKCLPIRGVCLFRTRDISHSYPCLASPTVPPCPPLPFP